MKSKDLSIDLLRTLALAARADTLTDVARRVGRSQSAISLRLKKLEDEIGVPLVRRNGRRTELTEVGQLVHAYAQQILTLNDDLVSAINGIDLEGSIRIGLPADLAESWLPTALSSFMRVHPKIHVEASVDRNLNLIEQARRGDLDIALAFGISPDLPGERIVRLPIHWIGRRRQAYHFEGEVPLALFNAPCLFRQTGIDSLESHGLRWRVAMTSPSLAGLSAAIEAGLGIGVRTELGLPANLAPITGGGLPTIDQTVQLNVLTPDEGASKAAQAFKAIAFESLRALSY